MTDNAKPFAATAVVPALPTLVLQNESNQKTKEKRNENHPNLSSCFDRNSHH
jgi:hypothetical protein